MSDHKKTDRDADPFHPPSIPTEVFCLHCEREYQSYLIEWRELDVDGVREGFWCCPTPGCDGKGFGFDIFPTDPAWQDEDGNLVFGQDEEEIELDEQYSDAALGFDDLDDDFEDVEVLGPLPPSQIQPPVGSGDLLVGLDTPLGFDIPINLNGQRGEAGGGPSQQDSPPVTDDEGEELS